MATVFITLAFTMLAHRMLWPLINRLVYAFQRIGIVQRRKLFGSIGVVLLLYAMFGVVGTDALKQILDKWFG